jgi:hypothetical protein
MQLENNLFYFTGKKCVCVCSFSFASGVVCACLTYSDSEESDFMMDFLIASLHFHVLGGKYY